MVDVEIAIGSKDIMRMLGWCRAKYYQRLRELETLGVVFYMRQGHPPRRVVKAFPSRVIKYASIAGKRHNPI